MNKNIFFMFSNLIGGDDDAEVVVNKCKRFFLILWTVLSILIIISLALALFNVPYFNYLNRATTLLDKAEELKDKGQEKAQELKDKGDEKVQELKDKGGDKIKEGTEKAKDTAIDKAKDIVH